MPDWKATLNGSTLCGGDCTGDETVDGCLTLPPDGLGVPALRTEDLSYPQRDGVEHFADWYEGRIVTLTGVVGGSCGCSTEVPSHARSLMNAWSRSCEDVELVLERECADVNPQLLPNPVFESGISDWEAGANTNLDWVADLGRLAPGSMSATLTLDNNGTTFHTDALIRVEPLETYQAAGFVSNPYGTLPHGFYLFIDLYDTDGVTLIGNGQSDRALPADPTWERMSVTYQVGTFTGDHGWIRLRIEQDGADPGLAGDVFLFDDFSLFHLAPSSERELTGPFGVRGRPRVAELTWRRGKRNVGDALLRFDATDQRLYILDADGSPGSGAVCSSIATPPSGFVYDSAVDGIAAIDSHWPLDFPRVGSYTGTPPNGFQLAEDVIGSDDAKVWRGYGANLGAVEQGPPISWNLSMSAIVGPAALQGPAFPNPYTSAMIGWWQQTDGVVLPCGATLNMGSSSIGQDALGQPSPEIRWGGTNVAMNADTQDAFGFTNTLRNQPVLIVVTWTVGQLNIYAGHENSGATKLVQSVSVGAFPTPALSAPRLTILGRVSNAMLAINGSPDGEAIADTLTPYAFDTPASQVQLADVGSLCAPIDVTFEAANNSTFGDVYIFKEDGTFVGLEASGIGVDNPSSLNTDTGTALGLFDTTDFTPRITGDPFLQVFPGETLHVFGGGSDSVITICYRPAVISA